MSASDPRLPVREYLQQYFKTGLSDAMDPSGPGFVFRLTGSDGELRHEVLVEPEFLQRHTADEIARFLSEHSLYDVLRQAGPTRVRVSAGGVEVDPREPGRGGAVSRDVHIPADRVVLHGHFALPVHPRGIVVFAHGSGSSRRSPRNRSVAAALNGDGFATLLFDLLTADEEAIDRSTAHLRFDIDLLARRLVAATDWVHAENVVSRLPIGYFGASTGAAAALVAAAARPAKVAAVVSRGGRPDLAGEALVAVLAPTLLIVGEDDAPVIELNRRALQQLRAQAKLVIVPGASHLFEEPGTLEKVAELASAWFIHVIGGQRAA